MAESYRARPDGTGGYHIGPDHGCLVEGLSSALIIGLVWWGCSSLVHHPTFSQLSLRGPVGAAWNPSSRKVTLKVTKISNTGTGESGDLRLAVYACDKPFVDGTIQGEIVASTDLKRHIMPSDSQGMFSQDLDVTLPEMLNQPKKIVVAVLEKSDGDEVISAFTNIPAQYTFRSDDWVKWYERISLWGWLGIVVAVGGLAGGTAMTLKMMSSRGHFR